MADFPGIRVRLPKGRQYALTWGIPDDFGGMTSAMLHRSRALTVLGRRPVDVLTFDARPDYPALEAELRSAGELLGGMRLLNLYDWFREHGIPDPPPGRRALAGRFFAPLDDDPRHRLSVRAGRQMSRTRHAADGTVVQTDHFREDGSLLVSDRRDTLVRGEPGGRSLVLCDASGEPACSWETSWSFYRFWLDLVRNREPSFMIVDSKTVARFMLTYRRRRAVTMHVVHNSHLSGSVRPFAPLKPSRRPVFERLEDFDAVVLLTPRQKEDVETLLGPSANLCVIPNSRRLARGRRLKYERPAGRGVVIAALTGRKRVHHAVRAVAAAGGLADSALTLDVFGDGQERERLRKLIGRLGAGDRVRLFGHRTDAREHLERASFIVLTGRTEGFPLVLVEAMAAGCIPIAYDVPYGPADVIAHGRNGFLVEPGDEQALAEAVSRLGALPARQLTRMRKAARRTAKVYSDAGVTRLWAREMRKAERFHRQFFGRPAGWARRAVRRCREVWPGTEGRARPAVVGSREWAVPGRYADQRVPVGGDPWPR